MFTFLLSATKRPTRKFAALSCSWNHVQPPRSMPEVKREPTVRIDCKQGLVKAVRFNADGQYAMTCGSDRTIKLWRPSKLLQLKCYKGHSAEVLDCHANPDSSQFVSCSNDRSLIAWDVESGKILRRFRRMAPLNSLQLGPNSSTVLVGSADGSACIYDLRALNAWEPIQTLSEARDAITCCRVQGQLIFTTSLDKCLRTYDVRTGKLLQDSFHKPLNHLALSQSGQQLLLACLRDQPLLVDRVKGQILHRFVGHQNHLFRLEGSFVLDDSCVASGSEDGRVYVWSLSGQEEPVCVLEQLDVKPAIIQTISSNSLDNLLTGCGGFMFMWSL